ncbi:MAG: hypothetical protein ACOWWM_11770 [Desulfobacterales bacterium]
MTGYRDEQLECHRQVRDAIARMGEVEKAALLNEITPYLELRRQVDRFQEAFFSDTCSEACFNSRLSACCTKDGIITFFADHAINALTAPLESLKSLIDALTGHRSTGKCIYLDPGGCRWHIKPVICEMFLCEPAARNIFSLYPEAGREWQRLQAAIKAFRWPIRPVLFDSLEKRFIALGVDSPLMHLHKSPGLIRLKQRHGVE